MLLIPFIISYFIFPNMEKKVFSGGKTLIFYAYYYYLIQVFQIGFICSDYFGFFRWFSCHAVVLISTCSCKENKCKCLARLHLDCTWWNSKSCYKFLKIKKNTASKNAPFLSIALLPMLLLQVVNFYYLKNFTCQRKNTEKKH